MATASVSGKKKPKKAKKLGQRLKVGEKVYTKESCSKKESDAKKKVKKLREDGKLARVKKDPVTGSFCVFARKKTKPAKKKAA